MAYDATVQIGAEFAPDTQSKLQRSLGQMEKNLKINLPINQISKDFSNFSGALDRANQRVITLGASFTILASSVRLFKEIVSSTISVEKSLTEINSVFQLTNQNLDRFSKGLFDVARQTSSSFEVAADAAKEFSRQGLSAEETLKRTRDALILNRLAGIDTADSIKALTSAINGFTKEGLDSTKVIDRLAAVDSAFAISSKDLADTLTRTGSAAADAGLSFNQLIALVTSAKQITGREGSVISQALNTIFTRVTRKGTLEDLEALGVQVTDLKGQVLPLIDVLKNFARVYDTLGNGPIKTQAAELVGGVRNLNTLKAVIGDLASANSIYAQALGKAGEATGQATARNDALNRSLASTLERISTTNTQVFANVGKNLGSGAFKSAADLYLDNPITKALADATGNAESIGGKIAEGVLKGLGNTLLLGAGPILAKALYMTVGRTFSGAISDIKQAAGITAQDAEQRALQSQIVSLYQSGNKELMAQLQTMTTLTERAALLRNVLSQIQTQQAATMTESAAIAQAMMASGYRVPRRGASGYIPHAAGGYTDAISAEMSAISRGVGGASSSARPVVIPNFAYGGGRYGPLVANTDEYIVPNFSAGGSAIFNPAMVRSMGLPSNARKVGAAGGYVPNAAGGGLDWKDVLSFQAASIKYGGLENLVKSLDISGLNLDVSKARIREKISKTLQDALDIDYRSLEAGPKRSFRKLVDEVLTVRKGDIESLQASQIAARNAEVDAIQAARSKVIINRSRKASAESQAQLAAEMEAGRYNIDSEDLNAGILTEAQYRRSLRRKRPSIPAAPTPFFTEQRLNNIGLTAALTLPFLSGLLPEGRGGTGSGIALGGASTALSGAGFGASLGLAIPGLGPLVGAGVGAVGGGIYGAIGKLTKSFEELSEEIDAQTTKRKNDLTGADAALQLQKQIISEIEQGQNPDRITALRRQQQSYINAVSDPVISKLLANGLNDPNIAEKISTRAVSESNRLNPQNGLKSAAGRIGKATDWSFVLGTYFGQGNFAPKQVEDVSSDISTALSGLSQTDAKALREAARQNPLQTFLALAGKSGLDKSGLDDITKILASRSEGGSSKSGRTLYGIENLLTAALDKALGDYIERDISGNDKKQATEDAAIVNNNKQIAAQVAAYQYQARLAQIRFGGASQFAQAQQQIALSNPALTELNRLGLSGQFGITNIQNQIAAQREQTLLSGRAGLLSLATNKSITPEGIAALKGISSVQDIQGLLAKLNDPNAIAANKINGLGAPEFVKALESLENQLKELDDTEKENTKTSEAILAAQRADLIDKKTLGYALKQDTGNVSASYDALTTAITQNAPKSTIRELDAKTRLDALAKFRRTGAISDDLFNSASLQINSELSYGKRLDAFRALQGQGREYRVSEEVKNIGQDLNERIDSVDIKLAAAQAAGSEKETINSLLKEQKDLNLQKQFQSGYLSESGLRLERLIFNKNRIYENPYSTGSDIESAGFAVAKERGLQGDRKGSFLSGFQSRFDGLKRDLNDLSDLGARVASNLENGLGNAFGDFITGAASAKDAFRGFVVSFLNDAARALASKAVQQLLGLTLSGVGDLFGGSSTKSAAGGALGFAMGGRVPVLLTGGEYAFSPASARRIGYDTLRAMNAGRYAEGGRVIRGGSGIKDDVPAMAPSGTFILKKSAVNRLGVGYLNALASGRVSRHASGGEVSWTNVNYGPSQTGGLLSSSQNASNTSSVLNSSASSASSSFVGNYGSTIATGLVGIALALIARSAGKKSEHLMSDSEILAASKKMESDQQSQISSLGGYRYRASDGQGNYTFGGLSGPADVRRFADGGDVVGGAAPMAIPAQKGGNIGVPNIGFQISITNHNGNTSSSTSTKDNPYGDQAFANRLRQEVEATVKQQLVKESLQGGFFQQRQRSVSGY